MNFFLHDSNLSDVPRPIFKSKTRIPSIDINIQDNLISQKSPDKNGMRTRALFDHANAQN